MNLLKAIKNNNYFFLAVLLILSLGAVVPLFHKGFFVTDDAEWMIIRFSAFYATLREGQFPVRFLHALNSGYGYPVATFLYPGFLYTGILLHVLKFGFIGTIKGILILSLLSTTVFTYFWLTKLFNKPTAFIASLFSLYIPYHLYDVYTRGSVGEVFALIWVPFILYMIERKNSFCMSIGIFLLVLSHNTLALLFLPFLLGYTLVRKTLPIKQVISTFFLGVLGSSFFIIPAIYELQYTHFSNTKIANPSSYFADITLIGPITIVIVTVALITFFYRRKKIKTTEQLVLYLLLVSILSIFITTAYSKFIWDSIPSNWIQFPFRILSYLIFSGAFLLAFIINEIKGVGRLFLYFLFGLVIIITTLPVLQQIKYFDKDDAYYYTNSATTTVQDEYMPNWVKQKPLTQPKEKAEIVKGIGKITAISTNNNAINLTVQLKGNGSVRINSIYWPGWNATVDGKITAINYQNRFGVMDINVPTGYHHVTLQFGETNLRLFSDFLSIVAFVYLIYSIYL